MNFTPSEVRNYYECRVPAVKIASHREWRGPCPVHGGKDPNFSVNAETGLAQCHSQCGRGWDLLSLEMELFGLDFARAKERVFAQIGRPNVPWEERNLEATYDYTDENGNLLYQSLRYHGKEFKQRRPGQQGGWIWSLGDVQRVPFHLEQVRKSEFVGVCEGERDVLTLERVGIVATCNNGGAGNFRPELATHFTGKHVAIFPDNDAPGREHALKVAAILAPVAKSLKIVEFPGLPEKGDVTDFISSGGTVEQIRELYRKAQPWTPDWEFASNVPDENEKYVRTLEAEVESAGGLTAFWDLAKFTGLPTPFAKLNHALGGGMRPGEVYVIGANQGAGKTSLALQFALTALRKGYGVLIFSMEMSWRAVFQRMAGIEAAVDLQAFRTAQIRKADTGTEMVRLSRATATIAGWKLQVSTKPCVTPEYISAETNRLSKRGQVDLVVVDHMQLMGADTSTRGEYEKFTAISRAMKYTASEVNVPLLLVSQTSRSNSRERRSELDVADLRGSGAIEEDAAGIFLLFEDRDDGDAAKREPDGNGQTRYTTGPVRTWLKIAKNRYGVQGAYMMLRHQKSETRFEADGHDED
jgi:KaiC/GvpD/RAD55 family RecA-like ATPase